MVWAFFALGAGAIMGAAIAGRAALSEPVLPWVARLTTTGLVLLLFSMGAGIGTDRTVLAGLGTLGLQAAAMAVFTVAGSVAAVALLCTSNVLSTGQQCSHHAGPPGEATPVHGRWTLTLVILASVAAGILLGALGMLPEAYVAALSSTGEAALATILLGIGVEIGHNRQAWQAMRRLGARALLVPAAIAVGSLAGALTAGAVTGLPANEAAAVGAGFGWYSLSGALLAQIYNAHTGALAFLSNVLRELVAVVAMPILASRLPAAAAMAPGGATTMDTTLPIIARSMGSEAALLAFASGVTLTILVPVLVPILIRM